MERLGVVGGMGPESTIAYYRSIIAVASALRPAAPHVPVLINSIDVQRVLRLVGENALAELADYLLAEIDVLAKAGVRYEAAVHDCCHVPDRRRSISRSVAGQT